MSSSALFYVLSNSPQQVSAPALGSDLTLLKLFAAIEELSAESRLVLSLHYHDELNFEEIASVLGISPSVVDLLHRAAMTELRGVGVSTS